MSDLESRRKFVNNVFYFLFVIYIYTTIFIQNINTFWHLNRKTWNLFLKKKLILRKTILVHVTQCRQIITYVTYLKLFLRGECLTKCKFIEVYVLRIFLQQENEYLQCDRKNLNISSFVVDEITKVRIVFNWSIRILTDDIIMPKIVKIKTNYYAQLARKKFFTEFNILAGLTRLIIAEVFKFHLNSSYCMTHIKNHISM